MVQTLWNTGWFLKKLNTELPYDPAIPLLGIDPNVCIYFLFVCFFMAAHTAHESSQARNRIRAAAATCATAVAMPDPEFTVPQQQHSYKLFKSGTQTNMCTP